MDYICSHAYAKVNLSLDIKSRNEAGYHLIESVMKRVNLYDVIFLCNKNGLGGLTYCINGIDPDRYNNVFENAEKSDSLFIIDSNNKYVPKNSSNIVFKALTLFEEKLGIREPVFVYINKMIPIGAGLGGGSADCACVLKMMNLLFGKPFTVKELTEMGKKLGSDVPFMFMQRPGLVTGIGEIITELDNFPPMNILVANSGIFCSTEKIYKAYDETDIPPEAHCDTETFIKDLSAGNWKEAGKNAKNVLEYPAFAQYPEIEGMKKRIACFPGCEFSMMTGSGSSVFGVFRTRKEMKIATDILRKEGLRAFCGEC